MRPRPRLPKARRKNSFFQQGRSLHALRPFVKDSYWRWPQRNLSGNAIDFCVQFLGLSFHDAMRQITGS